MTTVPLWKKIGIQKSKDKPPTPANFLNPQEDESLSAQAKLIYADFFNKIGSCQRTTSTISQNHPKCEPLKSTTSLNKELVQQRIVTRSQQLIPDEGDLCPEFERGMMLSPLTIESTPNEQEQVQKPNPIPHTKFIKNIEANKEDLKSIIAKQKKAV